MSSKSINNSHFQSGAIDIDSMYYPQTCLIVATKILYDNLPPLNSQISLPFPSTSSIKTTQDTEQTHLYLHNKTQDGKAPIAPSSQHAATQCKQSKSKL